MYQFECFNSLVARRVKSHRYPEAASYPQFSFIILSFVINEPIKKIVYRNISQCILTLFFSFFPLYYSPVALVPKYACKLDTGRHSSASNANSYM